MTSRQQFLYALYVYCKTQKKCGERIRALLDAHKPTPPIEGYEPFSCDSPSVPPIGGDF